MNALGLMIIISAYFLGAISSAVLFCRLAGLPDPRENASKNPGATNVFRIGGRSAAAFVMLFDMLKGMMPVWLSYKLGMSAFMLSMVGIAACLGHIYPVFFHFRGGKGVATALGAITPIGLDLTAIMCSLWLIAIVLTGYSSMGALIAALFAPFFTWLIKPQFTMPVAMLSCLIVFRHQENIKRLLDGTEFKINNKNSG